MKEAVLPPSLPPPRTFPDAAPAFAYRYARISRQGQHRGKSRSGEADSGMMSVGAWPLQSTACLPGAVPTKAHSERRTKNRTFRTSCRRMPAKHDWKTKKRAPAVCGMSVSRFKSDCQAQSKDDRRITICDPPKPETAPAPNRASPAPAPQPPLFYKQISKPEPVPGKVLGGGRLGGREPLSRGALPSRSFLFRGLFPPQAISPT